MADKPLKIEGPHRIERPDHDENTDAVVPNNRFKILGIVGVVVVLIIGGVLYFNWQGNQDNIQAATELGYARAYYDQADYTRAIDGDPSQVIDGKPVRGLAAIVSDYGSTEAGKAAALSLGNAYLATDRVAEASKAYETASGAEDGLVRAAALAGLAAVAEAEGKHDAAAEQYVKAATLYTSDFTAPLYLLGAALNYEKAGNNDKAIERYREIATRYSSSEQNTQARLALARLNVEI